MLWGSGGNFLNGAGSLLDIANMVLYLCSDEAGFITGENICIDGGMTKQMIYHDDFGGELKTEGKVEAIKQLPSLGSSVKYHKKENKKM